MSKDKDDTFNDFLLLGAVYQTARAEEAKDLHDDGYTVEEIAEEMNMDEDLVEEIVGGDDD